MDKSTALKFFGNASSLAKALGISESAISQWGKSVPQGRAYQIEVLTDGALKASRTALASQPQQSV